MKYTEIEGDLIKLALEGKFDVIAHGCNCFCKMKRGLAPQMAAAFGCDKYPLEEAPFTGDFQKLGTIQYQPKWITKGNLLCVVNCYTQYHWDTETKPLDYAALELCLKKMNYLFKGKHVGLPYVIGAHLAGGDPIVIKEMIKVQLKDCDVTLVKLPQNPW